MREWDWDVDRDGQADAEGRGDADTEGDAGWWRLAVSGRWR